MAGSSNELSVLLIYREESYYSLASTAGEAPEHSWRTIAHIVSEILSNISTCDHIRSMMVFYYVYLDVMCVCSS